VRILSDPIDETIFFAGEAIAGGDSQGTVESALQSGYAAATRLIKNYQPKKQS